MAESKSVRHSTLTLSPTVKASHVQTYSAAASLDEAERLRLRIAREHLHADPPRVVFRARP